MWAIESKEPNRTEWSFVGVTIYPHDEDYSKRIAERWTNNNKEGWVYRAVQYERVECGE